MELLRKINHNNFLFLIRFWSKKRDSRKSKLFGKWLKGTGVLGYLPCSALWVISAGHHRGLMSGRFEKNSVGHSSWSGKYQQNIVDCFENTVLMMAQTPVAKVQKSALKDSNSFSPFFIPPSPAMTKLGCGTGVNVYRFLRTANEGQSPWAVKKVAKRARPGISERLALEASILKTLQHPNIVGFRALAGNKDGDLCLAMEDCHMSLRDLIDEREYLEEKFTYKEVLKVAWSIAKALDYLHNEKKILHGDMKSGNVLIRGNFEAVKLCDFGVALRLKDDLSCVVGSPKRYIGSEPWKSREVLTQDSGGRVCDKTDIFAYGLTIWEMLTLGVPHVDLLGKYNAPVNVNPCPPPPSTRNNRGVG